MNETTFTHCKEYFPSISQIWIHIYKHMFQLLRREQHIPYFQTIREYCNINILCSRIKGTIFQINEIPIKVDWKQCTIKISLFSILNAHERLFSGNAMTVNILIVIALFFFCLFHFLSSLGGFLSCCSQSSLLLRSWILSLGDLWAAWELLHDCRY